VLQGQKPEGCADGEKMEGSKWVKIVATGWAGVGAPDLSGEVFRGICS